MKDHPGEEGGEIRIDADSPSLSLPSHLVSLSQLQRLRRQFLSLSRKHSISKVRIKSAFIEYLEENLDMG